MQQGMNKAVDFDGITYRVINKSTVKPEKLSEFDVATLIGEWPTKEIMEAQGSYGYEK